MNDKQKRFVQEYLVDMNATQAYIRAGYKAKDADSAGPRLLGNVRIRAAIDKALAKRNERIGISAERNLEELSCLAYFDPGDVFDFSGDQVTLKPGHQIPERARRAIASIKLKPNGTTEVRFWDKSSNIDKAMKYCGQLKDKVELTGKDGSPIGITASEIDKLSVEQCKRIVEDALRAANEGAAIREVPGAS